MEGNTERGVSGLSGQLELLVRKNEAFKQLITGGIERHISFIKGENKQGENDVTPDVADALERYQRLLGYVESGFEGFVLRHINLKPVEKKVTIYFSRPQDLIKQDKSRLSLDDGQKTQYVVILKKIDARSRLSISPEEIMEREGYLVEVVEETVRYDELAEAVRSVRNSGFSLFVTLYGKDYCWGTKHDGFVPYDSRKRYHLEPKTATGLNNHLDRLLKF